MHIRCEQIGIKEFLWNCYWIKQFYVPDNEWNIGSGKVFVLSDTNPSPDVMLTKLYNTIYCLWITICQHILQKINSCWTAIYQRWGILLLFSTFGNEATR